MPSLPVTDLSALPLITAQHSYKHIVHRTSASQPCLQVVGKLADKPIVDGQEISGLLVQQNRSDLIMHPDDLPLFTRLQRATVLQRQAVPLQASFAEARLSAVG